MKHTNKVTQILVVTFFLSQIIGLFIVNQYLDHKTIKETGELGYNDLPYFERPEIEENTSFWYIMAAILIGTAILLLIIKLKKVNLWKTWYFLSVVITLTFSLFALTKHFFGLNVAVITALIISLLAGYYKIFRPHIWIHNLTELFIYGGLAAIFVPIMNLFSAVMLLILISLYDFYAVWKSKHMVELAKFTTETNVFAGLSIPYDRKSGKLSSKPEKKLVSKKSKVKNAILGGGDIGFPLLFAGVVMKYLMVSEVMIIGFLKALIVPLFTTIALYILFVKGEKNKFYPAMPFLSAGCFIGYGILILLNMVF